MAKAAKSAKTAAPVPVLVAAPLPAIVQETPMDILMAALSPLGPDQAVGILRDLHHRQPLGRGRALLLAARIALIRAGAAALPHYSQPEAPVAEEPPPPAPDPVRVPARPALTTTLSLDDAARMLLQAGDDLAPEPDAAFSPIEFAPQPLAEDDAPPAPAKPAKRRKPSVPKLAPDLAASMDALDALRAADAVEDDDLAIALAPRPRPAIDLSAQMQALADMSESDLPPVAQPAPPPLDAGAMALLNAVDDAPTPPVATPKAKRTRKSATPPIDLAGAMASLRDDGTAAPSGDFSAQLADLNALDADPHPAPAPSVRPDLSASFATMEAAYGGPPSRVSPNPPQAGMLDLAAQFAAMGEDDGDGD